jgi:hypothetical protein
MKKAFKWLIRHLFKILDAWLCIVTAAIINLILYVAYLDIKKCSIGVIIFVALIIILSLYVVFGDTIKNKIDSITM